MDGLEDVMLSEVSQTQKDTHCMIPLREGRRVIKFRDRKWNGGCQELGGGGGLCCVGTASAWEEMTVRGALTSRMYLTPLNCPLENG